jgi:hypothetical protein
MLKNALLILLALGVVGCSAERRDVIRYFESMQPYFKQLDEIQARLKLISALPFPERSDAYRALSREASGVADKIAAMAAPPAVTAFHQQYTNLWRDFATFGDTLANVTDQKSPKEKRDEAGRQMDALQAAWPGKLKATVEAQDKLGKAYGIDFQ